MTPLPLLFYGYDFTGATDALATAARAGLRSLLLLELPDAARLASLGALDCLGIAGAVRSMPPAEMRDELAPVASLARALAPRVLHYKTCSTFDSSPEIGSVGEAVRVLGPAVAGKIVSIVGGQPNLGRHCLFGNLFASAGTNGEVFRVDRHPTMSRHPVTPMREADLRVHLAQQGFEGIGLVPWTLYAEGEEAVQAYLDKLGNAGHPAVLWDVAEAAHLPSLGRALWTQAQQASIFAVGPSSVIEAIAGVLHPDVPTTTSPVTPARGPVLVLAGSLSPVTARQVAAAHSFDVVRLDPVQLIEPGGSYRQAVAYDLAARLKAGNHALACTVPAEGAQAVISARELAQVGGLLLADVLRAAPVTRVGIAGGDTSSFATRALRAWGLTYAGQLGPGVPLCRLCSEDTAMDGMELMLKGGQMGHEDVFERLIHGLS